MKHTFKNFLPELHLKRHHTIVQMYEFHLKFNNLCGTSVWQFNLIMVGIHKRVSDYHFHLRLTSYYILCGCHWSEAEFTKVCSLLSWSNRWEMGRYALNCSQRLSKCSKSWVGLTTKSTIIAARNSDGHDVTRLMPFHHTSFGATVKTHDQTKLMEKACRIGKRTLLITLYTLHFEPQFLATAEAHTGNE